MRAEKHHRFKKPLRRKETKPKLKRIIAYDLETTRIKKGTPLPLYLTAFADGFNFSSRVFHLPHLLELLQQNFLTQEMKGARFVAWNANHFDSYFIGAALLHSPEYILRPYLTNHKQLRGLKVISKADSKLSWEFLDGMAMTGIKKSLKEFLQVFAPDYGKLESPNWEKEDFNPLHPDHIAYAERDSEGLYHGLMAAQVITLGSFNMPLQPTIGNLGIKIFQSRMPNGVEVWGLSLKTEAIVRNVVLRGGYCHDQQKYFGRVWKYDINQAYAAGMRDCALPAGRCIHSRGVNRFAHCGIFKLSATKSDNQIPFYYKTVDHKAVFGIGKIEETWLTSVEVDQLKREGWQLSILESYFWDSTFTMREYVGELEALREGAPGGTKSAQGEMIKAIGNNSYGKTLEELSGLELQLSLECPGGFARYQDANDLLQHVWFKFGKPLFREYHQPQLGAFITAHVRMEVRRAALTMPEAWLYADTDCCIYSKPNRALPEHPTHYGKWKLEVDGEVYWIIDKKVYAAVEGSEIRAKGMNLKKLSVLDMERWYAGAPPKQTQTHRQNFIKVMTGGEMFTECEKVGSKLHATAP